MKISTLKMLGFFVLLIGAYAAIEFFGGKGKSKGVRSELVNFESDAIDLVNVSANDKLVELTKASGDWKVKLINGDWVAADEAAVDRALEALAAVKPSRMASKSKEKWNEYQVDSTGSQVLLKAEEETVLDMIIGKMGMTGQRNFHSYVRLVEDDETYLVNDFMAYSVSSDVNNYRVKTVTDFPKDSIRAVKFIYSGDSSFIIENKNDDWMSANELLDSIKVNSYLNTITQLNSSKYYNGEEIGGESSASIEFQFDGIESTKLTLFGVDSIKVLQSSANLESYFDDKDLVDKLFVGLGELK